MIFLLFCLSIFGIFKNSESRGNIANYVGTTYWSNNKQIDDETNLKLSDLVDKNLRYSKIDEFRSGIAESNETVIIMGERVFRENVTKFCSELIEQHIFSTSQDFRDAIHFKPFATLPPPISNITIIFPTRWIRQFTSSGFQKSPTFFVCYEGDSFLRIEKIQPNLKQRWQNEQDTYVSIKNPYNEKCHVREILMFLDGIWHNHNLLPHSTKSIAKVDTGFTVRRKTFTQKCDSQKFVYQECCLSEDTVNRHKTMSPIYHCRGSVPINTQIPSFMSIKYEQFLKSVDFGRRLINQRAKFCHALEHSPVLYEKAEGVYEVVLDRNATKCAVVY